MPGLVLLLGKPVVAILFVILTLNVHLVLACTEQVGNSEGSLCTQDSAKESVSKSLNQWHRYKGFKRRVDTTARKKAEANGVGEMTIAALDWLVRHQETDGRWSVVDHHNRCLEEACKNKNSIHSEVKGQADIDVGVTGLAMLAFLGRGNTHLQAEKEEYRQALKKAAEWLITQQKHSKKDSENGRMSLQIPSAKHKGKVYLAHDSVAYNHAFGSLALSELLLGSGDHEFLAKPVQLAVRYSLRARSEDLGWKYKYQEDRSDTSISCWMMLTVFVAQLCKKQGWIDFEKSSSSDAWKGVLKWLEKVTASSTFWIGYESSGDHGSQLLGSFKTNQYSKKMSANTAAGLFILSVAGKKTYVVTKLVSVPAKPGSKLKPKKKAKKIRVRQRDLAKVLYQQLPSWVEPGKEKKVATINFYYWYYGAHAMYQVGGQGWRDFSKALRVTLKEHQRKEGCGNGSWDPIGAWGPAAGRVYTTAMGALCLQAGYRYGKGRLTR